MSTESTDIIIRRPDTTEFRTDNALIVSDARALAVVNSAAHEVGQKLLVRCARMEKTVHEKLDPIVNGAHKTHKDLTTLRGEILAPISEARSIVSRKIADYEIEETRKAEEARRRLEVEAKKAEEERQLQAAVDAEQSGDQAAAEDILEAPVEVPVIEVRPAFVRADGVSSRLLYSAEPAIDETRALLALAKHVTEHPEDVNLIKPNQSAIDGRARSQRDGFVLPGYKLVKRTSMAVRTAESA
jgi:hypothetical protein